MTDSNEDFERRKAIVQQMNIMDDDLFHKVAEDCLAMEEVLSVLVGQRKIKLVWSMPQVFLRNCGTRSVRLDALCKSKDGKLYSIEMEKSNKDDHQKRVRYNSSNIDTAYTEKGVDFKDIPELCMIYITKVDFFEDGCTIYHVNRIIQENGRRINNGMEEIYVNAKVDDGSEISQLVQYMKNTRGKHPLFPKLSARVKYLKEEKEGVSEMCEAVERYAEERAKETAKVTAKETAKETAIRMMQNGIDFEMVAKCVIQLTRKELEELREIS